MLKKFFKQIIIIVVYSLNSVGMIQAQDCDEFVTLVRSAKDTYMKAHRVYPVPARDEALALKFMPRIWTHPQSWQPIAFQDYLRNSSVVGNSDGQVIMRQPAWQDLAEIESDDQCRVHLKAPDVTSKNPAPIYIQVFRDENPADPSERWTYIKYNLVFDWSGLAAEISGWSRIGAFLTGGGVDRWHRLDIHTAAILAFDRSRRLRLLTLAQHNHQQTYLPGRDFPSDTAPLLVAATRSNELYLDDGRYSAVRHRVVPFFNDLAYLIDSSRRPRLWAQDVTYGRNAGGREVQLRPVFIEPGHPLADFAGLLAPPRRFLGIYIGRDGPPGYNYYALPSYVPLVNFAAMGFWRSGDKELLRQLEPLIDGDNPLNGSNWNEMVALMRKRLATALISRSPEGN